MPMFGPQLPQPGSLDEMLWNAQIPQAFQGLFGDAFTQQKQSRGQADALWQQLQEGMAAPPEEVDPQRAFMARLAGGISQALAPQMNGQALADSAIGSRNAMLAQRKQQTLSALHDRYKEAAAQAEEAGDTEKAIKMRSAELKINKELALESRANQLTDAATQRTFDAGQQSQRLGSQERIQADHDTRAIEEANIRYRVELAKAHMTVGTDGKPVAMPAMQRQEDIDSGVRAYITSGREKGVDAAKVLAGVRSSWSERAVEDGTGPKAMIPYVARLMKRFPIKKDGLVDRVTGANKPYKLNELVELLGTKFVASPGDITDIELPSMIRALRQTGEPRDKIIAEVNAFLKASDPSIVGDPIPAEVWESVYPKAAK